MGGVYLLWCFECWLWVCWLECALLAVCIECFLKYRMVCFGYCGVVV